jgi:hypothetical protein
MVDDEVGVRLHHRSTLGEKLTDEEQEQLRAWYEAKDREEAIMLGLARKRVMESEMTELIMQSNALAERFIQLTEENNVLLRENNALMRQLVDQVSIRTKQNQN